MSDIGVDFSHNRLDMLRTIRLLATLYNLGVLPKSYNSVSDVKYFSREFQLETARSRNA